MAADEVRPCVLDEGTFSEDSFYYLLMGHGSRRERVLFAMCQLVQILFLFIIVVPAFATDLSKGYLDKVSMDDDQEQLALFPNVPGYPKSVMDDDEAEALYGWVSAYADLIPQITIFTIFAVWSEYFANLMPEKSALFQMNGKVAGPRFFAELGMAFIIGTGGGYMFYYFCYYDDFWGYDYMPFFAFVPLVPWLGVMALSMAPSDSARSITFIKLASITGMIKCVVSPRPPSRSRVVRRPAALPRVRRAPRQTGPATDRDSKRLALSNCQTVAARRLTKHGAALPSHRVAFSRRRPATS